ncbi:MAG: efflux RND transporter periplasmic adaptor subunit [Verrucomicrobia bacterium]|nr:MAG: efflux RND transporter periplasmic adaptor subunit [Verrucomicrobiota bacterium]
MKSPDMNPPADEAFVTAASKAVPWYRSRPLHRLIVIAAMAVPIWLALHRAAPKKDVPVNFPSVSVAKVTVEDLDREWIVPAEFRPFQEVDLHAKVSGYLETILVDIGDRIEAGQLLATLEIPELLEDLSRARLMERRAAEDVRRTEAAYAEAHAAHGRLAAVDRAQPRLVARQDLDVAMARDQQAASAMATAKLQVDIARTETAKLNSTARYARIIAPFAGVVTRRSADPGALIPAGTSGSSQSSPLLRVSQVDRLRLGFPVSMSYVSRIAVGTPIEVRIANRVRPLAVKIARITGKIETATRTMEAEADVENADLSLIPGMYASVVIRLEHRPGALSIPVQALSREKTTNVMVVGPDHVLILRPVRVGLETPTRIEVLDGLREGDLVMVGGRGDAKAGARVEPRLATVD